MKGRGPEAEESVANESGLSYASFYHVGIERLDIPLRIEAFRTELARFNASDTETVVVDLEKVKFMHSDAIRELFLFHKQLRQNGRNGVVLLDTPEAVLHKFDELGFLGIFPQYTSKA
jgi:anti-anti-sigma factor